MGSRQPLPVVAGPTASGKTGLAIYLAEHLNGEVVSADSMQVYDTLYIGTARPSVTEMRRIPHHLMGFVPLTEPYHVARYTGEAHKAIQEVAGRDHLPILCGGTGLYIRSVVDNLSYANEPSSPALREILRSRYDTEGGEALLRELEDVDPQTAARLHPNDAGRIIRALELYQSTGITMSEQLVRSRQTPSPYNAYLLVLDFHDRQVLYERIDRRVDYMLEAGLLEEARTLLNAPHASTALQAIGYKELIPYFAGNLSLAQAIENIKRGTRRYAKRQLSWFRGMEQARPLYVDEYASIQDLCREALRRVTDYYSLKEESR